MPRRKARDALFKAEATKQRFQSLCLVFFWSGFEVWDLAFKLAVSGLLLGRFSYVILLRKPNYSLYTHNLVTSIRNLTSNPVFCGCLAEGLGASGVFGFAVGI